MNKDKKRLGFAMCGSFCTFSHCFEVLENLIKAGWEIIPIMSYNAYSTDTRFGKAAEHVKRLEEMCGREVIHTIDGAEPIGPKNMTDIMLVANCTGNTLAKLAMSITDTAVVVKRKEKRADFLNRLLRFYSVLASANCFFRSTLSSYIRLSAILKSF